MEFESRTLIVHNNPNPELEGLPYDIVHSILQHLSFLDCVRLGLSSPKLYEKLKVYHPNPILANSPVLLPMSPHVHLQFPLGYFLQSWSGLAIFDLIEVLSRIIFVDLRQFKVRRGKALKWLAERRIQEGGKSRMVTESEKRDFWDADVWADELGISEEEWENRMDDYYRSRASEAWGVNGFTCADYELLCFPHPKTFAKEPDWDMAATNIMEESIKYFRSAEMWKDHWEVSSVWEKHQKYLERFFEVGELGELMPLFTAWVSEGQKRRRALRKLRKKAAF